MNAFGEYFRQDDSTPSKKQTNKQTKKNTKRTTSQKRSRQEKFVNKLHLEITSDIGSSLVEEFSSSVIAGLQLFFDIHGLFSWSQGGCHHSNH